MARSSTFGKDTGLQIRMTVVFFLLGALYVGLVAALLTSGVNGVTVAIIAGGLAAVQLFGGDKLALRAMGGREVTPEEAPELHAMIERLCIQADLPKPKVAVADNRMPNAFALGRGPKSATVCATTGIMELLSPAELEGVMAHELMHVRHRDILIGSVAAAIATAISAIAQMAMFATMFSGGDDEDRPNPIAVLLVSLVAPIAASLIQMAVSRSREFEADRGAAELLGTGEPLARALERIEIYAARIPMQVAPAQAQAYIHNPLSEQHRRQGGGVNVAKLFSTHPPTDERIRRLRAI